MDVKKIFSRLGDSLVSIKRKNGHLTLDDVCKEIINNACLDILQTRNKGDYYNKKEETDKALIYIACGRKLFPPFDGTYLSIAEYGIKQNLEWPEMWHFLRQYFRENHEINIDGVCSTIKTFISNRQSRYQNGELIVTANDLRVAKVEYLNLIDILISIEPNVSLKSAHMTKAIAEICIYVSDDPDYRFEIHGSTDITKVVAHRDDKNFKIVYDL